MFKNVKNVRLNNSKNLTNQNRIGLLNAIDSAYIGNLAKSMGG